MLRGKLGELFMPSRHLGADAVVYGKPLSRYAAQFFFQLEIAPWTHGGLGEEFDRSGDINRSVVDQGIQRFGAFDHQRPAAGSSHEGKHLGVAYLTKNKHLGAPCGSLHLVLEAQHHGAGTIDDVQPKFFDATVCGGRFSVGPYKHRGAFGKGVKTAVGSDLQPKALQAGELGLIVDYFSQRP